MNRHTLVSISLAVLTTGAILSATACGGEKADSSRPDSAEVTPDEATASSGTSAPTKATPAGLDASIQGVEDVEKLGSYVIELTLAGEKHEIRPRNLTKKPFTLKIATGVGATVSLAGIQANADDKGIAALAITPNQLLMLWNDGVPLDKADEPTRLDTTLKTNMLVTRGDEKRVLKASFEMKDIVRWWLEVSHDLDLELPDIPTASDDAIGVLIYTPRTGLHYMGPRGGLTHIRYIALTVDQDKVDKDCGNYLTSTGSGRLVVEMQHEYTWVTDVVAGKLKKKFWMKAQSPCKRKVKSTVLNQTLRPHPHWTVNDVAKFWSKWAMKAGYWGPMIKAKDAQGKWSRAVVLGQQDGKTCVRYRGSFPQEDRCLGAKKLRLPKAAKAE